ncbi:hypothetical protein ACFWIB_42880 [Streptomyces sp. NPDC127051]|uniref:hypothetical protein n=1 Tax=Streptomyces sp. NPDC127051 TaxID=3347119 RepID=UPI00365CE17E
MAVNQLAELLDMHLPGGKAVFANLDSDIAVAFLQRHPTPAAPPGSPPDASKPGASVTATPAGSPATF